MTRPITIIGAGPAGMTAALFAAKNGAKVRLIDSNEQVGRKLLVTGSGRANLTNQRMDASRYACADPAWMQNLLAGFGHADLIEFLNEIGVLTFATHDGWCYPISESAQTVVDVFASAIKLAGIELVLNTKVTSIQKEQNSFRLSLSSNMDLETEKLIIASGGKAYPTLGSHGEIFPFIKALGHTTTPLTPALAPVICEMKTWKALSGVRFDARTALFEEDRLLAETTGNLIFTDWGLNGPAVMDLSHHISSQTNSRLKLVINPLFKEEAALRDLFSRKRQTRTPISVILGSVLQPKLAKFLLNQAGYPENSECKDLNDQQFEKIIKVISNMTFKVSGVRGFEYCQVSAGGVPVNEIDPLNMRSRIVPGLWLAGETIDVVGPCGGYNLQFAFSSGALAGKSCAMAKNQKKMETE